MTFFVIKQRKVFLTCSKTFFFKKKKKISIPSFYFISLKKNPWEIIKEHFLMEITRLLCKIGTTES